MPLYTIGYNPTYEQILLSPTPPHKLGPFDDGGDHYYGGIAFPAVKDAQAFIAATPDYQPNFGVYLLEGDFARDTYQRADENFARIKLDRRVLMRADG